ncbi:MAG: hypothetical protein ACLGIG_02855 [Actinomycetes bacterium]
MTNPGEPGQDFGSAPSNTPGTQQPLPEVLVRRVLALPVLLGLVAVVVPHATADVSTPAGTQVQSYDGAFVAPTRFTDGEGGWPGLGRKVYLAAQAADGVVADVFPVDPRAVGGRFELGNVADATGAGNLDVFFYGDMASVADGTPVTTGEFASPEPGESGFVPQGTEYAIVFSPDAVRPTFTFTAFSRPVVDLTALDGVTVVAGTTLGVLNDTGDYASFKHASTRPIIDRSATGDWLRVGEVVDVTLARAGTYVFESSVGTATVTVTS